MEDSWSLPPFICGETDDTSPKRRQQWDIGSQVRCLFSRPCSTCLRLRASPVFHCFTPKHFHAWLWGWQQGCSQPKLSKRSQSHFESLSIMWPAPSKQCSCKRCFWLRRRRTEAHEKGLKQREKMVSILREAQGGMKFRNVRTRHNTSASRRPAQAPRGGPGGAHRNLEGNHRKKWWVRPACDGWHV